MFGRRKIATLVAEFLGTGVLTLLILSVQRSTIGVPFFVAMAAGLTFALMTFSLGAISGGYFNPALTLAQWTARKLSTVTAILFVIMQFLGAYAAYHLYIYFVNQPLQDVAGKFSGRILVAEAVGAGIFAFGWSAALYQRFTPAVTASVAGLSLMVGTVAASAASIGLLNPAVALGVKAWAWAYVLGPIVGAVIGTNLYGLLFAETEAVAGTAAAATAKPEVVATAATTKAASKPARAPRKTAAKSTAKRTTAKRKTTAKKK